MSICGIDLRTERHDRPLSRRDDRALREDARLAHDRHGLRVRRRVSFGRLFERVAKSDPQLRLVPVSERGAP
jgi:hypothetical protein